MPPEGLVVLPCPTVNGNRQTELCRPEKSMVTKRLGVSSMRVWVMLSDKTPGLAEVVAEDTRNLKGVVGGERK